MENTMDKVIITVSRKRYSRNYRKGMYISFRKYC